MKKTINFASYEAAKKQALMITESYPISGYVGIILDGNGDCHITDFLTASTSYNDGEGEETIEIVETWTIREWLDGNDVPSEKKEDDIEALWDDECGNWIQELERNYNISYE